MTGSATVVRGDALNLDIPDASVDLIVTSPPYFGLRSYQDGGEHYSGQIGSEPTPAEFVDALIAATREMMRVLKPSGSIWVNLGDSYAGSSKGSGSPISDKSTLRGNGHVGGGPKAKATSRGQRVKRASAEQMTRCDAAWLAGVIDSDGSISIHVNKQPEGNAPSFVPSLRIGQMRPEVVQRAAEVTGIGQVFKDSRGVWNWAASAQQSRWVLERIWPWLLIKQRPALAAIEVARHVEERNAKGSWRPLTTDDIAYRQRLREAVYAWNRGAVDDLEVPVPPRVPLPEYAGLPKPKSLTGLPWRYALRCIDELGLILRAEVIWSKPNGLPESVTDRVRRSHETWFHFVVRPRYYSAVDEVREEHGDRHGGGRSLSHLNAAAQNGRVVTVGLDSNPRHPLGKLPGSVWTIPTQPLKVPAHLGVDHFAAFPMEWPRRIIRGWSPAEVCSACGEGRRPVGTSRITHDRGRRQFNPQSGNVGVLGKEREYTITGYACACPDTSAPSTPGVVLDPFGGTGTTALVAKALGRHGISNDLSADYCRLAEWRTNDPGELARGMQVEKPDAVHIDQLDLFGETA